MEMNHYRDLVERMGPTERENSARNSFSLINGLPERNDIILGLCAGAKLYSTDIRDFAYISEYFSDLGTFIGMADNLDKSERFEAGIKTFFIVNNLSSTNRDIIFTGFYASAMINNISIDHIADQVVPEINVGRAKSIW